MKTEEFISSLSDISRKNAYRFERIRACIPLGRDDAGNVVAAHREENPARYHHVCVTGGGRADFICRLVLTLSCIYDKSEAGFLVLSPRPEYAELLRLKNADVTVPYIRSLADYVVAVTALGELVRVRAMGQGYPRLFVVLDGLESLSETPADGMLSSYNACFQAVGASGVEVVTGVELHGSIFGGFPGAFVGIGVKQDGLVHISQLADRYVASPADVVHLGQHVEVKVTGIDTVRSRISLTMRRNS